ncbi:MAG: cell envelope integrity protein CreD [Steroidobacteraceae bacterium]
MTPIANSATVKAAILTVIALLLLIPQSLLSGLVTERTTQRDSAVLSVARGWGDRQWVSGPVLAIPVTTDSDPNRTCDWYVLPDRLDVSVNLQVQDARRRLGLYDVPVYVARIHAKGEFDLPREIARLTQGGTSWHLHLEQARLLLPLQDPRGLRDLTSETQEFQNFEPSTGFPIPVLAAAMNAAADASGSHHAFDLSFDVAGTQSLEFLPLARVMSVQAHGNWSDPGFTDGFLPIERQIDARGFTAKWQILNLNRTYGDRWFQDSTSTAALLASGFGIELVQPVDIYQRSTRAVKYGGLFIALSFLTLFLVENLQRRSVHPIQYGLMGLALSLFYLLLLALAEHIGFLWAYILATSALCILMGVYLAAALRSRAAGALSGAIFAATYALLYLLVTSESYALLAGSLALFALLTTTMFLTRKIDWYAQGASQDPGS